MRVTQVLLVIAACLVGLTGCETPSKFADLFRTNGDPQSASASDPDATGTVSPSTGEEPTAGLLGSDPKDDLSVAKQHFRQENFGLAEHYFRRAVESRPRDGEAWLGLAASYDRLKRFDLADRAYAQVIKIAGPTAEVLNNQGYSYILRGNYVRAREKLAAAQALDPSSPYITNNLTLLEQSARKRKGIKQ
jgi:Flp pilus assembly protein TadD